MSELTDALRQVGGLTCNAAADEIERLRAEVERLRSERNTQQEQRDAARAERDALQMQLNTHRLGLTAVAWYFDQKRYSVSPVGDGTYYCHDKQGARYAVQLRGPGDEWWPSPYAAIKHAQYHAAREAEGEG